MGRSPLPYYCPHLVPFLVAYGLYYQGITTYYAGLLLFIIIPSLDLLVDLRVSSPSPDEVRELGHNFWFKLSLWVYPFTYMFEVVWCCYVVSHHQLATYEFVGLALSMSALAGLANGIAHELCHRSTFEKNLSFLMTTLTWTMKSALEHPLGHHKIAATEEDTQTAKLGQSYYSYLVSSNIATFKFAWQFEANRLAKFGYSTWSWRNRILFAQVIFPILATTTIYYTWGRPALLTYLGVTISNNMVLEIVNYIEHYGLARKKYPDGSYEPFSYRHAWDSEHLISSWFLFRVGLHADHHLYPGKRYQVLTKVEKSPKMPTGYFGMAHMCLIPPLWRYVMDPLAIKHTNYSL